MAMTPEGRVKDKVKKVLKREAVWFYMPVQNGMGVVGIPDIVGCIPMRITEDMVGKTVGVFMGIETKAPGKEKNTTANQKNNLEGIARCGGVALVTDNTERVEDMLLSLAKGDPVKYVP